MKADVELAVLDQVAISSPCPVDWASMEGDARVRFCGQCQLNVYDLSALTRAEATALLERTEGRLCARIYRRPDGKVLTADCPVGAGARQRRVRRTTASLGALVAAVLGAVGARGYQAHRSDLEQARELERLEAQAELERKKTELECVSVTMGVVARPQRLPITGQGQ